MAKQITGAEDLLDQGYSPDEIARSLSLKGKVNKDGYESTIKPRIGEFILDSEYDNDIQAGQNQQSLRADRQAGSTQALNAIVGGIASGLATAVEDVSYILDFDNHIKSIQGLDTNEKNWLAEAMGELKEDIDEALPIYRRSNEVFDWGDSGFYWGAFKGVIDSAVGFGLPGGAIAKGVSIGLKATRATKLIQMISKGPQGVKVAESLGAGFVQNYAEGKIMALETYENTLEGFSEMIDKGEITEERAKELAGQAADDMLSSNRAMILTDAFSLYGLSKGLNTTRNILKQKGTANRFKNFGKNLIAPNADNLILQSSKEAGEEIIQNVMQMESQYQADIEGGKDRDDVSKDLSNRLLSFAKSDQALLEGLMGFFGGGPQRILSEVMSGNMTKSAKEKYKERYNAQQTVLSENGEFIEGTIKNTNERVKLRNELIAKGETKKAAEVSRSESQAVILKNLENGTTGEFINSIEETIREKGSEIGADGVRELENILEETKWLEKQYIKHSDKINVSEIVSNRGQARINDNLKDIVREKISNKKEELTKGIERIVAGKYKNTYKKTEEKKLFGLYTTTKDGQSEFTYDLENLTTNPYAGKGDAEKGARNQYNKFVGEVKKIPEYQELKDLEKELRDVEASALEIESEYSNLTSKNAAKEYVQRQNEKALESAIQNKFKNENEEATVSDYDFNKVYKDNKGGAYLVKAHPSDKNKVTIHKVGKASGLSITKEEFEKRFKGANGYTSFESKEDVENATKKAEATSANIAATQQPVKTPEEEIAAKSRVQFSDLAEKIEPSNDESKREYTGEKDLLNRKSTNILSLAWLSPNNLRAYKDTEQNDRKEDEAIAEFLENPDNKLEGSTVKFELIEDADDPINNANIGVSLLDEVGNVITHKGYPITFNIHLPSYANNMGDAAESYIEDIKEFRKKVYDKLKAGEDVYSTIAEKKAGQIQTDPDKENLNVKNKLKEEDSSKIELVFSNSNGELNKVVDPKKTGKDDNITTSDKLGETIDHDRAVGAIFTPVKMANGTYMPLRLRASNLNEAQANLVIDIYLAMIKNQVHPKTKLGDEKASALMETINSDETLSTLLDIIVESNLNGISKEQFSKESVTVTEMLNWLVYEGEMDSGKNTFPLYAKGGKIYFGKNGSGVSKASAIANNRQPLLDYLMKEKIHNINNRALNIPAYKDYLFDNEVLTSNALSNERGVVFAQPTVVLEESTRPTKEKSEASSMFDFNEDVPDSEHTIGNIPGLNAALKPTQQNNEVNSTLPKVSKEIPFNYGNNKKLILNGDKTITSRNFKFIPNLNPGESGIQTVDNVDFKVTYHGELKHSEVKEKTGIDYSEGEAFSKTTKGAPTEKATVDFINGKGTKHIYQFSKIQPTQQTSDIETNKQEVKLHTIKITKGEVEDIEEDIVDNEDYEGVMSIVTEKYGTFTKFFNDNIEAMGIPLDEVSREDLAAVKESYIELIEKCIK